MNPATLLKLVREVPGVHYVKEEVAPAHHNIARLAEAGEPALWGVFGGGGAQNLLDELRRGGAGNMPASQYTDVVSRVFSLWEAGQESEARDLHMRLQPALQRERLAGVASAKAVLVKRGIIRSERRAAPARPWTATTGRSWTPSGPRSRPSSAGSASCATGARTGTCTWDLR